MRTPRKQMLERAQRIQIHPRSPRLSPGQSDSLRAATLCLAGCGPTGASRGRLILGSAFRLNMLGHKMAVGAEPSFHQRLCLIHKCVGQRIAPDVGDRNGLPFSLQHKLNLSAGAPNTVRCHGSAGAHALLQCPALERLQLSNRVVVSLAFPVSQPRQKSHRNDDHADANPKFDLLFHRDAPASPALSRCVRFYHSQKTRPPCPSTVLGRLRGPVVPVSSARGRKHGLRHASLRRPSACRIHRARTVSRRPGPVGTPIVTPQSSPELFPAPAKSAPHVWVSGNAVSAPPPPSIAAPSIKKAPSSRKIRSLPGIPKYASEKIPRAETPHARLRPFCRLWKRPRPPAAQPPRPETHRAENRETPLLSGAMHCQEKVCVYERAGTALPIPAVAASARYVPRKRSGRSRHTAAQLHLSSHSECSGTAARPQIVFA